MCLALPARLAASKTIHAKLVSRLLSAAISFYDTTPLGRVLNRFTKDMDSVDMNLGRIIAQVASFLPTCDTP